MNPLNPVSNIQMLPFAAVTMFIAGLFYFQSQCAANFSFANLVPISCLAAMRTISISIFAPILTFFVIAGVLDGLGGPATAKLWGFPIAFISLSLLIALSCGITFGLTQLATKMFGTMVALKDNTQIWNAILWLLALEPVAVTLSLGLQLVFIPREIM